MAYFRSDFLNILSERGFICHASGLVGLDNICSKGTITAYVGYDATASSLHVGNLLSIMMLSWLQLCGHRPIVLLGGGTSLIGDPSGKSETRKLLTADDVASNMCSISKLFEKLLDFDDSCSGAILTNNAEWLLKLNYIDFLRDVGRYFSVNKMLSFDSVRVRLEREQSISFLEFNYMLLQAYDFLELYHRYGCILQMGGSDQWGNMLNGIELGRRKNGLDLFAIASPLLSNAEGVKMGKSIRGSVWLCDEFLCPYDYWQYWRNIKDEDVSKFLSLYTRLPLSEVKQLSKLGGAELNEAKKILATEATAIVHGRKAAEIAAKTAHETFEEETLAINLPVVQLSKVEFGHGISVMDAFVRAGLALSNGEVRRGVIGKAIRVNGTLVVDPTLVLADADVTMDGFVKLSYGKKRHVLLRLI